MQLVEIDFLLVLCVVPESVEQIVCGFADDAISVRELAIAVVVAVPIAIK